MENSLHKIDTLRQDIRKAEKLRRELEVRQENSLHKIDTLRQDIRKAEKLRRELEVRQKDLIDQFFKNKISKRQEEIKLIYIYR